MLEKDESIAVIIAIIIFELLIFFPFRLSIANFHLIFIPPLVIITSVLAKKVAAPYYFIKIKHKIWHFQRFGFYEDSKLKKEFPIGIVLPLVITILTLGVIKIFTFLQFDYKNIPKKRILRKRGWYRYKEVNDSDLSFTSAWSFYSLLLLSIIGIIIKIMLDLDFGADLAKYSVLYGICNILPISKLDGSRLFYGSTLTYFILLILYCLFLGLIFII